MLPRAVDKFPNFDWTTIEWKKDVSLRNLEKRDDLGFYSPDTQYFYEECIVTKKIKGVTTRVFKKPTKLSQVGWVFSPSLVEELNNSETEREAHAYRRPSTQPSMTLPEDLTQNFKTLPTTPRLTKQSATGGVWKSPDHRALRDTLGKGGMNLPAEELMTKLDTNVLLNVKFFPVLKLGLTEAMAGPKKFEIQDSQ
ncbi:hypothetical protein C8J56DRAFT_1048706 [Mycena floridula]|nr:hypothetical protein C8J56DRAFT_1048695 [Mycena floridula]KAJ7589078.1 hypothetical protein C8J56DRAFT_1048706 [Mycena floridula]